MCSSSSPRSTALPATSFTSTARAAPLARTTAWMGGLPWVSSTRSATWVSRAHWPSSREASACSRFSWRPIPSPSATTCSSRQPTARTPMTTAPRMSSRRWFTARQLT